MTILGIGIPIIAAVISMFQGHIGIQSIGVTSHTPYSSSYSETERNSFAGIGFFVVLLIANLTVVRGFQSLQARRPRALLSLGFGLLMPLLFEVLGGLQRYIPYYSASTRPQRYHYYYFAPDSSVGIQSLWSALVPSSMLPVVAHAASLVFLILGYAARSMIQAETTSL
ncbi:MAG: hypothetical protein WCI55_03810 [Armatimonadota bacterium]